MSLWTDQIAAWKSKIAGQTDRLFGAIQILGLYSTDATPAADGDAVPLRTNATGRIEFVPAAGAGLATEAKQDTGNATLASILTKLGAGLGAALTAGGGVKTGLVDAIPAGTNTIGKVDQGAAGATPWLVSSDATLYRARTPTSAVATATVALQQLSAIVTPAITTHLNFRMCVPDTADTGVYVGTSTHQTLLLPGREFAIDSTSLVGWYIKRGGGADVIVTIFGLVNT